MGTWEERGRLEITRERLTRERAASQRSYEVKKVADKISAEAPRLATKRREEPASMEAAADRQEVARIEHDR